MAYCLPPFHMSNAIKFIISIAIPLAVGWTGSYFTTPEIGGWFQTIQKPSWNPPNNVFGPVWTTLYVLMGIALFLVWKAVAAPARKQWAMGIFFLQLLLNFAWSILFFNQHQIGWALVDIAALWLCILITIFAFAKINKAAAWLLVPYISWVSFASILNYTIWILNK